MCVDKHTVWFGHSIKVCFVPLASVSDENEVPEGSFGVFLCRNGTALIIQPLEA